MKVLLKADVQGVGHAGQVKEVADGYARNYLVPRGLAVIATPTALKQAADAQAMVARRAAEDQAAAVALKDRLEAATVVVESKAGSQGRLYGSVTTTDVANAVQAQLGTTLDRRELELSEPIRQVGTYKVRARLPRGVVATLNLDVRAAGGAAG
jgi:large subunit ribosomal protein L9